MNHSSTPLRHRKVETPSPQNYDAKRLMQIEIENMVASAISSSKYHGINLGRSYFPEYSGK